MENSLELKFLDAQDTKKTLSRYIDKFDEFHWAVAWGTLTDVAKKAIKNSRKFRNVTFGVAFSQSDPNLIDELVGLKNVYVATKFSGGTYHPKVYCFCSGNKFAAIVGSANFTAGGMGKNHEGAICIEGSTNEPIFTEITEFTTKSAEFGEMVTKQYADAYRVSHKRAARLPKAPRVPVPNLNKINIKSFSSPLIDMTWESYVKSVRGSRYHNIGQSIDLLRIAQEWFVKTPSFSNLSAAQRKAVAGIIGEYQKTDEQLNRDWGWFGSMKGMGDFANRIDQNDEFLARAIDSIPQKGEVTQAHYDRFSDLFIQAFANSERVGGVATASRLLAMKRPDTFLCVCKPNIIAASEELGFAKSTLSLKNYWDRVVKVIMLADWYNAEKPDGIDADLWEYRVAMLDAILYAP